MIATTRIRTVTAITALAAAGALAVTTVPADAGTAFTTTAKSAARSPKPTPHLVDIRVGRHASFDRVVLDLRGQAPGYKVGYVDTVREDGSGKVIDMRGNANLMVRLQPAQAHRSDGSPTYTGSKRMFVGYPELREVAFAGDFEGVVSIALGLHAKRGFRVMTLSDPTRIVVDVAH
jgi:hypothetical protein